MRGALDILLVLGQIAARNLVASRWRTGIIAGIIGMGAFLVVVGSALLDGVDRAMRGNIIGSVAGHIQVYSRESHDPLELLGGFDVDAPDLAPLDFAAVRRALASIPNIAAVVPMAIGNAVVGTGNSVDQTLSSLRALVDQRARGDDSPELERRYQAQKQLMRQVLAVLGKDLDQAGEIERMTTISPESRALIARAQTPAFWSELDADPYRQLELLENRIAPLTGDGDPFLLRYVGTDPERFARAFNRMRIVDGQAIPRGQRGFLFSKLVYEEQMKLKCARGLDKLMEAREQRGARIASHADLQRIVRANVVGVREILLQLDPLENELFRSKLQSYLGSRENDVGTLLARFFETDDANLSDRNRFFYAELAPVLDLYRVRIGDTLTIKALTRGGYVKSTALHIYGTFNFAGLEKSPQAGALNIMDLVSFRELYGFVTAEHAREIEALRAAAGVHDVPRESAESELFGTRAPVETIAAPAPSAAADSGRSQAAPAHLRAMADVYDPAQLESGVVLNAAVLVKDERRIDETMSAIERAGVRAQLPLKAVSWQTASGPTGQFAAMMRGVLYTAIAIIFIVALVIINNALVMATLERVSELGTLRALGAQRSAVLAIVLFESAFIGVLASAIGGALGLALLARLSHTGVPAVHAALNFFFSGPRLYPVLRAPQLAVAVTLVLLVSVASGLYPAWLAMRLSPREAMQPEE